MMTGCSTIFVGETKKPEVKKPLVVTINHYHYFVMVNQDDMKKLEYRHKKHPGEAVYNYQKDKKKDDKMKSEHRKRRGCIPCEVK